MEILDILKWPVLIFIVIFLFRKSIRELFANIADFSLTKDGLSARVYRPIVRTKKNETLSNEMNHDYNPDYFSKDKTGNVSFDYSNNNGTYTIGEDEYRFDTKWSKASSEYIHFYNDPPSIKSVRLAKDEEDLNKVNPDRYDDSSRARSAGIGQIAIFENQNGKFLAVKILDIKDDTRGDDFDELSFQYKIL
ncbi:MAG TPA: hypothetical protein VLB83_00175 [Candidatus Paceibacterota bacterium]|nr:hypothetical protein [Candidatus Paceibacterota bacterium]